MSIKKLKRNSKRTNLLELMMREKLLLTVLLLVMVAATFTTEAKKWKIDPGAAKATIEGQVAAMNGQPVIVNPYETGSEYYSVWYLGWRDGQ